MNKQEEFICFLFIMAYLCPIIFFVWGLSIFFLLDIILTYFGYTGIIVLLLLVILSMYRLIKRIKKIIR